jgi:hypothetical protein
MPRLFFGKASETAFAPGNSKSRALFSMNGDIVDRPSPRFHLPFMSMSHGLSISYFIARNIKIYIVAVCLAT